MKSELDLIKFTLTREMAEEMININNMKKLLVNKRIEYNNLKEKNGDTKLLESEIKDLESTINISKKKFINLFQKNNKEEIKEYLNIIERQEF